MYNKDKNKLNELIHEYEYIVGKLNDLNQVGELTSLEKNCIERGMSKEDALAISELKEEDISKELS